jgi:hypothetical protein
MITLNEGDKWGMVLLFHNGEVCRVDDSGRSGSVASGTFSHIHDGFGDGIFYGTGWENYSITQWDVNSFFLTQVKNGVTKTSVLLTNYNAFTSIANACTSLRVSGNINMDDMSGIITYGYDGMPRTYIDNVSISYIVGLYTVTEDFESYADGSDINGINGTVGTWNSSQARKE